jgi:predicted amidohydrolase
MRVGLLQLRSGDDPAANVAAGEAMIRQAAAQGARFVLTPEVSNLLSGSRALQARVLVSEADDPMLARFRGLTRELGIWLLIGSLALRSGDADERFVNRSVLIGPDGAVRARYDKIHMFDVDLEGGEFYRESAAFRPGDRAVVTDVDGVGLGLSICYDLRFPYLYRALAHGGARILTVPAAFTVPTGRAHWHVLLRARAIETGCFVLAPAQCGVHRMSEGPERRTFGHSLAVSPWGAVLADGGEEPGVTLVDLDLDEVDRARRAVPSLRHDREVRLG